MPKPDLFAYDATLEHELIETLIAGHHEWRRDLAYPESYSDMQGAVRGLLRMFKVERRPLPESLRLKCIACAGLGQRIVETSEDGGFQRREDCTTCHRKGWIAG